MSDKRAAIIEPLRAGKTNSEIVKLLKVPRSTVYHTVSRFKELQSTEDRPRSGRPRSSRTSKMINTVRARIRRNPKRSMRAMAHDINVSEKTIRNIVQTHLKMSSLKMQTRQHLTDLQKEKRVARAKIFLNKLKAGTDTSEIIFSDKKLFTRQLRTRARSFSLTKDCSLSRQFATDKITESYRSSLQTFLTPRGAFSGDRNLFLSWCRRPFQKHGSPPSFLFYKEQK